MFSNQSAYMSFNGPCRAVDTIRGDTINNRFIIGTCIVNHSSSNNTGTASSSSSNRGHNNTSSSIVNDTNNNVKNRLCVIEYRNDTNEIQKQNEYDHFTGSVYTISTHPTDPSLVLTSSEQSSGATLWKIPQQQQQQQSLGYGDDDYQQQTHGGDDDYDDEYDKSNSNYYYNSQQGNNSNNSIWKSNTNNIDDNATNHGVQEMERLATLLHPDDDDHDGEEGNSNTNNSIQYSMPTTTTSIAWRDSGDDNCAGGTTTSISSSTGDVVMIDLHGRITQWDVSFGTADPTQRTTVRKQSSSTSVSAVTSAPKIVWDPHSNGTVVAASYGNTVHLLDWRIDTTIPSGIVDTVTNCHKFGGITDIQYNPNKPYLLVTAGKDSLIKFWDIRSTKQQPILTARGGHSHYVTNIKYNPFHDQLLLSTGTDSVVNLWRFSTISSAPLLSYDENTGTNENFFTNTTTSTNNNISTSDYYDDPNSSNSPVNNNNKTGTATDSSAPNACVTRYEHGTGNAGSSSSSNGGIGGIHSAVYGATWGYSDAWIYLTASYDGQVVLQHVPSHEKYKILL